MFSQSQRKDLWFVTKVINKKCSLGQWIQRLPHQTVITSPAPPFLRQLKFRLLTKNWFWRLIVPCSTVLDHLKHREDNCPLGLIELSVWYPQSWSSSLQFCPDLQTIGDSFREVSQPEEEHHGWCLSQLHSWNLCWTEGNGKQTLYFKSGISSYSCDCSNVSSYKLHSF